jgi:rRNA maturation protein Rpf1
MRTFCHDLANCIPNVVRANRGKMSLDGLAEKAIELEANKVIVVERWHGGPGRISLFQVASNGLAQVPPLMLISGIRLRREFDGKPKRARSSVITLKAFDSSKLERVAWCLSNYFGLPVMSLDEASESHKASMHLSVGSSRRLQITFLLLGRMIEIGPRVTLSKLIWNVTS